VKAFAIAIKQGGAVF